MVLVERHDGNAGYGKRAVNRARLQQRPIEDARALLRLLEDIAEALTQDVEGLLRSVSRDRLAAAIMAEGAQLVDAMTMVRVIMRVEDGVEAPDAGIEELQPQIRRGVDEHR